MTGIRLKKQSYGPENTYGWPVQGRIAGLLRREKDLEGTPRLKREARLIRCYELGRTGCTCTARADI